MRKELAILAIAISLSRNPYIISLSIYFIITYSLVLVRFCKLAIVLAYKGYLAC
jgi:hypothetical protein